MKDLLEAIRIKSGIPNTSVIENTRRPGEFFICFGHIALAQIMFEDGKLKLHDPDTLSIAFESIVANFSIADPSCDFEPIIKYLNNKVREWGLIYDEYEEDSP